MRGKEVEYGGDTGGKKGEYGGRKGVNLTSMAVTRYSERMEMKIVIIPIQIIDPQKPKIFSSSSSSPPSSPFSSWKNLGGKWGIEKTRTERRTK